MIHAYDELQLEKKNPVVSVVKLNSTVAYIREKFFDLRVVPVVSVVRLFRNSLGGVQKKTKELT